MWKVVVIGLLILAVIALIGFLSCDVRALLDCARNNIPGDLCRELIKYTCH